MDRHRYEELEADPNARLTDDELAEGWHWCHEWDQMLVGPGMPEMDACHCL